MAWRFTKVSAILLRKPNSLLDFPQAEAARLDDLLSDATQKKMKAQRKLLAKLAKVSAKDEL